MSRNFHHEMHLATYFVFDIYMYVPFKFKIPNEINLNKDRFNKIVLLEIFTRRNHKINFDVVFL